MTATTTEPKEAYLKKVPFWERPFPQLYRCKTCGQYGLMKKPEPWAMHLCDMPLNFWQLSRQGQREAMDRTREGHWEFVAEGREALDIWNKLKPEEQAT